MENLTQEPLPELDMAPVFSNDFISLKEGTDDRVEITVGNGKGAAALVRKGTKVLLVRTPRYATGSMEWALPRGSSTEDESPEETAARCVEGWTGVSVDEMSITSLGEMYPDAQVLTNEVSLFLMSASDGKVKTNHENVRWIDAGELMLACVTGEIEDSFTCMAVLRARIAGKL